MRFLHRPVFALPMLNAYGNEVLKLDSRAEVANQDAKTLRTGGGYILNSMAKVEAQAFLRELRLWAKSALSHWVEPGGKAVMSRHALLHPEAHCEWDKEGKQIEATKKTDWSSLVYFACFLPKYGERSQMTTFFRGWHDKHQSLRSKAALHLRWLSDNDIRPVRSWGQVDLSGIEWIVHSHEYLDHFIFFVWMRNMWLEPRTACVSWTFRKICVSICVLGQELLLFWLLCPPQASSYARRCMQKKWVMYGDVLPAAFWFYLHNSAFMHCMANIPLVYRERHFNSDDSEPVWNRQSCFIRRFSRVSRGGHTIGQSWVPQEWDCQGIILCVNKSASVLINH